MIFSLSILATAVLFGGMTACFGIASDFVPVRPV